MPPQKVSPTHEEAPDYSDYLRVDELLGLQVPTTPAVEERTHLGEHFFIVAHQVTELWLSQLLRELDAAAEAVPTGDDGEDDEPLERCLEHLDRASVISTKMVESVSVLLHLPHDVFVDFRPRLGDASGAQSTQFHLLRQRLREGSEDPLWGAFLKCVAHHGVSVDRVFIDTAPYSVPRRLAAGLLQLSDSIWSWQIRHMQVVHSLLGNSRGTGRTDGAQYLVRRAHPPFPALWSARTIKE